MRADIASLNSVRKVCIVSRHRRYRPKRNGCENPHRHTLGLLTLVKKGASVKKSESIAGTKEAKDNAPFTRGSVEREKNGEVLECQLVIVS